MESPPPLAYYLSQKSKYFPLYIIHFFFFFVCVYVYVICFVLFDFYENCLRKRVFPGSSSSCMEAEVVEIAPPMSRISKSKSKLQSQSLKQKEVR